MQLAVPRYSQKTFPKSRHTQDGDLQDAPFVPQSKKSKPLFPSEKWMLNCQYLYGIDLFNHGYWFKASEVWREVFDTTEREDLTEKYLRGLIQFSSALLKLHQVDKKSFLSLYRASLTDLEACLEEMGQHKSCHIMGLHLREWLERVATFEDAIDAIDHESPDPLHLASFPSILLEK